MKWNVWSSDMQLFNNACNGFEQFLHSPWLTVPHSVDKQPATSKHLQAKIILYSYYSTSPLCNKNKRANILIVALCKRGLITFWFYSVSDCMILWGIWYLWHLKCCQFESVISHVHRSCVLTMLVLLCNEKNAMKRSTETVWMCTYTFRMEVCMLRMWTRRGITSFVPCNIQLLNKLWSHGLSLALSWTCTSFINFPKLCFMWWFYDICM